MYYRFESKKSVDEVLDILEREVYQKESFLDFDENGDCFFYGNIYEDNTFKIRRKKKYSRDNFPAVARGFVHKDDDNAYTIIDMWINLPFFFLLILSILTVVFLYMIFTVIRDGIHLGDDILVLIIPPVIIGILCIIGAYDIKLVKEKLQEMFPGNWNIRGRFF